MKKLLTTTALILSLSLSGMAYADDAVKTDSGKQHEHHMGGMFSNLPKDKVAAFKTSMKSVHEQNKPIFEQLKTAKNDLNGVITADKFDKDAYIAKSKQIQDLSAQIHTNMTAAFADELATLTPAQRKTVADAMHKKHHGHGGKKDGKAEDSKPAATK